jgi:hypothetical protein
MGRPAAALLVDPQKRDGRRGSPICGGGSDAMYRQQAGNRNRGQHRGDVRVDSHPPGPPHANIVARERAHCEDRARRQVVYKAMPEWTPAVHLYLPVDMPLVIVTIKHCSRRAEGHDH